MCFRGCDSFAIFSPLHVPASHNSHQIIRLCVESSMLRIYRDLLLLFARTMCQMKSEKMRFDNGNLLVFAIYGKNNNLALLMKIHETKADKKEFRESHEALTCHRGFSANYQHLFLSLFGDKILI